jgi:MFS family permease
MSSTPAHRPNRISAWLRRWRPLLPLFGAELIVLIGFGALLPVLPLYIEEHGIDATGLGIIVAGYAIGKLISEPVWGWWADRHARKPQMVAGLLVIGIVSALPLIFTTFLAFFTLRFIMGMAAAAYDPAARGMLVEATAEGERGEAFGYYGAFQIAGFVIGPAIGGIGATIFGGYAFPFIFSAVLALVGAVFLARYLDPAPQPIQSGEFERRLGAQPIPAGDPFTASETLVVPTDASTTEAPAPLSAVFNRTVVAALVLTFGLHLSFGTYEVVWSLYLIALGASVAWVSLTFMLFGIPEMILGPLAGRVVDRRGPVGVVLASSLMIMFSGMIYATASHYLVPSMVVPFEAAATAAMMPALYAMLARGTPRGRSSTTQGIFGSVSTMALVVASLVAGWLFERGVGLPFWFFVAGTLVCTIVGLLIYRSAGPRTPRPAAPEARSAA